MANHKQNKLRTGHTNNLKENIMKNFDKSDVEKSEEKIMENSEEKVVEKMAKAEGDTDMCKEDSERKNVEVMSVRSIEELLQKNAPKHREKISKILTKILTSRIKNISIDYLEPRFAYMECWQRDVIEKIAEVYKTSGKILPIITNIHGEVLVGNTLFHAAETLGVEYIPAIRITALAEDSFAIYWLSSVIFASKLGFEQWEFLRMQLEEFKGIGQ